MKTGSKSLANQKSGKTLFFWVRQNVWVSFLVLRCSLNILRSNPRKFFQTKLPWWQSRSRLALEHSNAGWHRGLCQSPVSPPGAPVTPGTGSGARSCSPSSTHIHPGSSPPTLGLQEMPPALGTSGGSSSLSHHSPITQDRATSIESTKKSPGSFISFFPP